MRAEINECLNRSVRIVADPLFIFQRAQSVASFFVEVAIPTAVDLAGV
jgi:hypothetical protein